MGSEKLTAAIQLIKSGNKSAALPLLKEYVFDNPDDANGWSWLYLCVEKIDQKIYCLQQVLRINPTNQKAQDALEKLENHNLSISEQAQQSSQQPNIAKQVQVSNSIKQNNRPSSSISKKSNPWIWISGIALLILMGLIYIACIYLQTGNLVKIPFAESATNTIIPTPTLEPTSTFTPSPTKTLTPTKTKTPIATPISTPTPKINQEVVTYLQKLAVFDNQYNELFPGDSSEDSSKGYYALNSMFTKLEKLTGPEEVTLCDSIFKLAVLNAEGYFMYSMQSFQVPGDLVSEYGNLAYIDGINSIDYYQQYVLERNSLLQSVNMSAESAGFKNN
ncbi:MAG: hypothetical protein AB9897_03365 [Anaerolineaceae bacterium]